MPILPSPLAERDLDEIWLFLAAEASHNTADRVIDAIGRALAMLAAHPTRDVL